MRTAKKWEIIHVPDSLPTPVDQQHTVDVVAAIIEPKDAHTIIRRLSKIAVLEDLRHIRRVQKKSVDGGKEQLSVILCLAVEYRNQLENISDDINELIKTYQLIPFITKVSKYAASTKTEWEAQCKLWPTSYHSPTYNIDGITGFSDEDSQIIINFMKYAVKLSISGPQVVNTAVIVDPSHRLVIAAACDQSLRFISTEKKINFDAHFVGHPELLFSHEPDAIGTDIYDTLLSNRDCVSCLYPWKWTENGRCAKKKTGSWHPLRHAALIAIGNAAARDIKLFPGKEKSPNLKAEIEPAKRQKIQVMNEEDNPALKACSNVVCSKLLKPYLCTGYDIYLVWEPCVMCAMALVHQRFRRIFYAFTNPNCGALGSTQRLQGEKSLNHHYAVFRVMIPGTSSMENHTS